MLHCALSRRGMKSCKHTLCSFSALLLFSIYKHNIWSVHVLRSLLLWCVFSDILISARLRHLRRHVVQSNIDVAVLLLSSGSFSKFQIKIISRSGRRISPALLPPLNKDLQLSKESHQQLRHSFKMSPVISAIMSPEFKLWFWGMQRSSMKHPMVHYGDFITCLIDAIIAKSTSYPE